MWRASTYLLITPWAAINFAGTRASNSSHSVTIFKGFIGWIYVTLAIIITRGTAMFTGAHSPILAYFSIWITPRLADMAK